MSTSNLSSVLGLYCCPTSGDESLVDTLLNELQLTKLNHPPEHYEPGQFVVVLDQQGLSLHFTGRGSPGPVQVNFIDGASAHRRHYGGGKGQLIAKAVGIKGGFRPHILDVTAGLGQDGFVLATLGSSVTLVERVPLIFQLLQNGLQRASESNDIALREIVSRINIHQQQSIEYLRALTEPADIIYLDPMFPERTKSAQVKKSMLAFQTIVGGDTDAGELLQLALEKAKYRVVVKRPRKAPAIHQQYTECDLPAPGLVLEGKSSRYDIYPLAKMPNA